MFLRYDQFDHNETGPSIASPFRSDFSTVEAPIFKTVAFDLDGTLADTGPDLAAALNCALAYLDRPPQALEIVRAMIGHGTRALLQRGLTATGDCSEALIDTAYPVLMRFYEDHICDLTRPYPGLEKALDQLSGAGVALAICTNKPLYLTKALIGALGWSGRFASVVGGDSLAVSKPDPAPLIEAISRASGGPAAFVGDSIVDVLTAQAARIPCIAVSFGFADRPVGELGADLVIDHYDSLLPGLGGLFSSGEPVLTC
ncbi:MAG: phosphoglycolate phosphatase [Caulobacter sp.]|nr:phosphoglycolate phosphatase [Caulobacter sp.]